MMVPSGSQRSRKQGGFRRGCLVIITLVVSVMCLLSDDTTEVIINETQQLQTSWISSCGFYIGAGIFGRIPWLCEMTPTLRKPLCSEICTVHS